MKKLLIALAMINLMFHVTGCKSKKAQEETEIVENADVEKADQELLAEGATTTGPIDESLQAALGEAPQQDIVDVSPTAEVQTGTDIASSPAPESTQTAAVDPTITETPTIDEAALLASTPETPATTPEATVESTVTPAPEVAMTGPAVTEQTGPVDNSLMASNDTGITETPVTENAAPTQETSITETPVTASSETSIVDSTVDTPVVAKASTEKAVSASSSNKLKKISETEPYKHGEGFVNTVYIARPKESLKEISQNIYGADKTSELKSINSFLAKRSPRGGDKIYYVSPNRPTDSSKTLSYYEDTGMASETYVAKKGDNLRTVAKNLLGYDNGWKEMWTTNSVESQSRLTEGETLRYWKPKQVVSAPVSTVAQNDMPKLTDTPPAMPEPQPAQPVEAQPAQPVAQELPPPPAEMQPAQPVEAQPAQPVAQELPPPPPPQEIPPPPPAPEQMAAPTAPKEMARPHAEEEVAEEGGLSQDMMMTLGGIAVLVALLALVLVRKNKKKKEAELASIENTHVGT